MNNLRHELLLLSLFGQDRPGQLDAVARVIADLKGNWLESRILRLAGHFTGLLRISLAAEEHDNLHAALQKIAGLQTQLIVLETAEDEAAKKEDQDQRATLELTGYDRPGIVRTVTKLLNQQGVDIETFESELRRAPMSGDPTFYARVQLSIPQGDAVDDLAHTLERLGSDLMVDIHLDPLEVA